MEVMTSQHHVENDRFLTLLHQRRNRRASVLSSILQEPSSSTSQRSLATSTTTPSSPTSTNTHQRNNQLSQSYHSIIQPCNLSTHYLFTTSRPQNEIQNPFPNCFEGYPKLQRLTDLKKSLVLSKAHPPTSLRISFPKENLLQKLTAGLPTPIQPPAQGLRFDVIVISEDGGREGFNDISSLATLPIESLAATPSFLFLWLVSSDSLEIGRALLQKWGFRRAEDIVWVKTNHSEMQDWKDGKTSIPMGRKRVEDSSDAVFVRTKEHCLMGIRGTVRRSVDSHFIHCNIDTDVIVGEERRDASTAKPEELYSIIENFCMGRRRLEIFGCDQSLRPGWLTVGSKLSVSNYDPKEYLSYFQDGNLVGHHPGMYS